MPGAMHEYFRGNPHGKNPMEFLREREPIPPHYLGSKARVAVMDEQGLESCWLFPTLGVLYEELLKEDPEGVAILFRAFNEWLYEDWGYNYENRIFAAPYIALGDYTMLKRDMCFSEEPGLYDPENGCGFNWSNTIVVGKKKGYRMSFVPYTKEWCWIKI